MVLNLDLIIVFSFILGLIGAFIGISLIGKVTGKLRTAIIFLFVAEIIFTIGIVMNILNFMEKINLINLVFWNNIIDIGISLFLLFAFFNLLFMIKRVRNK